MKTPKPEVIPTTPPPPPPRKELPTIPEDEADAEGPRPSRPSSPSRAPSQRDGGRHKVPRKPTPPEGTAVVIRDRSPSGLAHAITQSCCIITH